MKRRKRKKYCTDIDELESGHSSNLPNVVFSRLEEFVVDEQTHNVTFLQFKWHFVFELCPDAI